jgi:hypothetical protein
VSERLESNFEPLCVLAQKRFNQQRFDSADRLLKKNLVAMKTSRHGGTLIELLVALVLLNLAMLSLAAVGAATARRVGDAARRSRATLAAANRLERLAALPCSAMSGGAGQLEPRVIETWIATRAGASVELSDSIEITGRIPEHIVVRRRAPCL